MNKAIGKTGREVGPDAMQDLPQLGPEFSFLASELPHDRAKRSAIDWRKRMSDNIAYALLVYTGLQIFVTMSALRGEGSSLLPYLALVILVVAIIPSCRRFERRWNRLSDAQATDAAMARYYRRDQALLWLLAIGLPFAITGVFRLLAAIYG